MITVKGHSDDLVVVRIGGKTYEHPSGGQARVTIVIPGWVIVGDLTYTDEGEWRWSVHQGAPDLEVERPESGDDVITVHEEGTVTVGEVWG